MHTRCPDPHTMHLGPGELLNCNAVDVATQTAVQLHADKLIFLTGGEVADLKLPYWLPVADAQRLLTDLYCKVCCCVRQVCHVVVCAYSTYPGCTYNPPPSFAIRFPRICCI